MVKTTEQLNTINIDDEFVEIVGKFDCLKSSYRPSNFLEMFFDI